MPFRFRKSIKILPGVKLNLSKSGISTSLGKRGASINIGKRGVRTTVGIPGTGLSYSAQTSTPKATQQRSTSSQSTTIKNTDSKGSGCLNGLVALMAVPFRILADLIKGISNPQTRRSSLIIIAIIGATGLLCIGTLSVLGSAGGSVTTTPTVDMVSLQNTSIARAWDLYTQTALALPSATSTETLAPTPAETSTPLPTETLAPTATPLPTNTVVYVPPTAEHPLGSTGQCV